MELKDAISDMERAYEEYKKLEDAETIKKMICMCAYYIVYENYLYGLE